VRDVVMVEHVRVLITSPAGSVERSIVMSTSVCVCLSVCLSASISPESHAQSLPIFVHVAYGRGSVLLRQGDKIPRGRGNFGCFPSN